MTEPVIQEADLAPQRVSVLQANANNALAGLYPDAADLAIQAEYLTDAKTISDLLRHARACASQARGQHLD